MRIRHWQDAASLLVGVWLVLSPFALGFAAAVTWITILLGLGVILFALEGIVVPSYLEEWGENSARFGPAGGTVGSRLRVGIGHGKQRGVRSAGDLVCSLGIGDRS